MPKQSDDPFWHIAMNDRDVDKRLHPETLADSDDEDENQCSALVPFKLESSLYGSLTLQLSPLAQTSGIWAPLGAQAWYASALLTCMISHGDCCHRLSNCTSPAVRTSFTAIELGSGAIGLPGIALGWLLLSQSDKTLLDRKTFSIYLTDNEPKVLTQLQSNVSASLKLFDEKFKNYNLDELFSVNLLDWKDGITSLNLTNDNSVGRIDLVMGAELVYTPATATACTNILKSILDRHPNALIVIVQVTDRDGWNNIFLPSLRNDTSIQICQESIPYFIHTQASRLIQPHGSKLDDFGAYFISKAVKVYS
jgi:hypothetical protein